jgi:ribosomal protein L37E
MAQTENVRRGKGAGFIADGKLYLQRCFECGRENWAPMVASGQCAWCGFDANAESQAPPAAEGE